MDKITQSIESLNRAKNGDSLANYQAIMQGFFEKGINANVIAFVNNYDMVMDSFLDYEKGGKYEGKDLSKDNARIFNPRAMALAYATPRSLAAAGDILDEGDGVLDDDTLEAALVGTVGAVTAEDMASFVRFGRDICSFDRVVADPLKAPLADKPISTVDSSLPIRVAL